MKNKSNNQPQPAPTQLFSAAEANAFSPVLMNVISGIYSNNSTTQTDAFRALIEYFANNHATDEELDFLTLSTNNIVERIIHALRQINTDAAGSLASAVGGAVISRINNSAVLESDLFTGNEASSSENDEYSDVDLFGANINNSAALESDLFTGDEASSSENDEDSDSDVDLFGANNMNDY
jgi:hypothetical protein